MGWKDVVKQGAVKSSSFIKTAAPAVTRVTNSAGTVIDTAKGVTLGAGATAGAGVVNAFSDPGFVLFVAGLLTFWFTDLLVASNAPGAIYISIIIGSIFLFFSSIFIFKGKGLLLTIIFWLWYVPYGRATDPTSLLYLLLPMVIVAMLLHGILSKFSRHGTFGEGVSGEFAGLVVVLFFFLDLGALDFLVKIFHFPTSGLAYSLLIYMPWWAFLGLFCTKKENFLITLCRVVGVMYLVIIISVSIIPTAYTSSKSFVPGPEQFLQAKKDVQAQLPKQENIFISQLACLSSGEFVDSNGCVQRRQEASRLKYICTETEHQQEGTLGYDQCLQDQQKKAKEGIAITGSNDPARSIPMTADIITDQFFPKTVYRRSDEELKQNYPAQLKIENPRKATITGEAHCYFKKAGQDGQKVDGKIIGGEKISFAQQETTYSATLVCQPQDALNGNYQLVYEAKLLNLQSSSVLRRAFIGDKDNSWKQEWLPRIMDSYFNGQNHLSQAAADLARINFAFGNPVEYPVVESSRGLALSLNVVNAGHGKITAITQYALTLPDFIVDDQRCLDGQDITVPPEVIFSDSVYQHTCFITSLPSSLTNPDKFVYQEFSATVNYDYLITREIPLEVKVLS